MLNYKYSFRLNSITNQKITSLWQGMECRQFGRHKLHECLFCSKMQHFPQETMCSWLHIHHKIALLVTVSPGSMRWLQVSSLQSPTKATLQQWVQTPLQTVLGHPFGDRSSCSPLALSFFDSFSRKFLTQPCCETWFLRCIVVFAGPVPTWKTHFLYKDEVGYE